MGVDEAGEHGFAPTVDDAACVVAGEILDGADRRDAVARDRHRARVYHSPLIVDRYHRAALEQQIATHSGVVGHGEGSLRVAPRRIY